MLIVTMHVPFWRSGRGLQGDGLTHLAPPRESMKLERDHTDRDCRCCCCFGVYAPLGVMFQATVAEAFPGGYRGQLRDPTSRLSAVGLLLVAELWRCSAAAWQRSSRGGRALLADWRAASPLVTRARETCFKPFILNRLRRCLALACSRGCVGLLRRGAEASKKLTTSSGGSLGSWVDEDRSKMRVVM